MNSSEIHLPYSVANHLEEKRCVDLLHSALTGQPGVQSLALNMPAGQLTLRFDPTVISLTHIQQIAKSLGVELGERYETCLWRLKGIRCADCSLQIDEALRTTPGVTRIVVSPAAESIGVEYESQSTNVQVLEEQFAKAGYEVRTRPRTREELAASHAEEAGERRRMAILTGLCLAFLLSGLAADLLLHAPPIVVIALYVVSYATGGIYATTGALRELRGGSVNVDLLMIAAALGAAAVNAWPEGAILLFLFSLSGTLEKYVLGYTRRAIEALMDLTPSEAVVKRDGIEAKVPVEQLRFGDTIVVRPGERIASDGVITEGRTSIDQSAMTGESLPVEKTIGDGVFAATLNQQGAIEVRVTRVAGETTLARIVQLVEEAQSERAQAQHVTEWFGEKYTLGVLALSAVTFLVPLFLMGHSFDVAFYRAMTVLVVASPCAVVISIPAAILSAITSAARGGVLLKGGAHLETAARLRAIAFDKTGTLTIGRPTVTDVVSDDEHAMLKLAGSAESLSEHPIAKAITAKAKEHGIELWTARNLQALIGRGVRAEVDARTALLGKAELFAEVGVAVPEALKAKGAELQSHGKTVIFVGDTTQVLGLVAVADVLRPSAAEAMRELRAIGIEHTIMLTGDNQAVAAAIAGEIGMEYEAELMPEDKLNAVKRLREKYGTVAMVGDGINDAPSLAASSLGVSLGGSGTDVALETADMVLMGDDLRRLPYVVRLAREADNVIRQNLIFAFGMMLFLLATAYFGSLRLPIAVFGHEGSTVLVILNGIRLLAFPRERKR
ncbi:MAG: cation-translocating P-type ATPase [Chloroflexi bacterium]|nr:cation-translocating P-type ATPase [Chloroflexota bacterium]